MIFIRAYYTQIASQTCGVLVSRGIGAESPCNVEAKVVLHADSYMNKRPNHTPEFFDDLARACGIRTCVRIPHERYVRMVWYVHTLIACSVQTPFASY